MSQQAHFLKIGLFVIAAVVLLVVGLIVLGAGVFFREKILLETYINESVQGIDVGTPVKFRGVSIGNVKHVDFVYNIYQTTEPPAVEPGNDSRRAVYILLEVNPKALGNVGASSIPVFLNREVGRGLRVRMSPQGLTGLFFLELDYMDPVRYPPQPVDWAPDHHYIPSVQSTITLFIESIAEVFARLEQADVAGLIERTAATVDQLNKSLTDADLAGVSGEARNAMESIRRVSDEMSRFLDSSNLDDLTSETRTLVATARRQIELNGDQLQTLSRQLGDTAANAERISARLDRYMDGDEGREDLVQLRQTLGSIRTAAESLPENLNRTLRRADRLLESQQHDMELILENFRRISENLRALSEQARDYPSGVIFGGPPKPVQEGAP
jgi:paraquat-inducible protein B